jgi:hypothetical protein
MEYYILYRNRRPEPEGPASRQRSLTVPDGRADLADDPYLNASRFSGRLGIFIESGQ